MQINQLDLNEIDECCSICYLFSEAGQTQVVDNGINTN
jgi:hypothetical protein